LIYADAAVNWFKKKVNQFTAVVPLVKTLSSVPISFYGKYLFWFGDSWFFFIWTPGKRQWNLYCAFGTL